MRVIKIFKFLLPLIFLSTFFADYAKSTDECFEIPVEQYLNLTWRWMKLF